MVLFLGDVCADCETLVVRRQSRGTSLSEVLIGVRRMCMYKCLRLYRDSKKRRYMMVVVDYREETRSGRAHGIACCSFVAEVLSSWCCSHYVLELS